MTAARTLLAPILNVDGVETPSLAARLWLWAVAVPVLAWSWRLSDGMVVPTLVITGLLCSVLLPFGWFVFAVMAKRYEPRQG